MRDKFPLIQRWLEFEVSKDLSTGIYFVPAEYLEEKLAKGIFMHVSDEQVDLFGWTAVQEFTEDTNEDRGVYQHEGLMIGIRPIEREDTAESLLRELYTTYKKADADEWKKTSAIFERAKALLDLEAE